MWQPLDLWNSNRRCKLRYIQRFHAGRRGIVSRSEHTISCSGHYHKLSGQTSVIRRPHYTYALIRFRSFHFCSFRVAFSSRFQETTKRPATFHRFILRLFSNRSTKLFNSSWIMLPCVSFFSFFSIVSMR